MINHTWQIADRKLAHNQWKFSPTSSRLHALDASPASEAHVRFFSFLYRKEHAIKISTPGCSLDDWYTRDPTSEASTAAARASRLTSKVESFHFMHYQWKFSVSSPEVLCCRFLRRLFFFRIWICLIFCINNACRILRDGFDFLSTDFMMIHCALRDSRIPIFEVKSMKV